MSQPGKSVALAQAIPLRDIRLCFSQSTRSAQQLLWRRVEQLLNLWQRVEQLFHVPSAQLTPLKYIAVLTECQ